MLGAFFRDRRIPLLELSKGACVPLRFDGRRDEHLATRRAAGLFDFSFMGSFRITGRDGRRYLHRLQTRNLGVLAPGRIAYTLLLRNDGTVLTDATVWCLAEDDYLLFTGRREEIAHLIEHAAAFAVELEDASQRTAILAVQGPASHAVLEPIAEGIELGTLPYFAFAPARLFGEPCRIGRLGYSGELGYEIVADASAGDKLWQHLMQAGRAHGLRECGFEAAYSLRIEAGLILYSSELAEAVTPFELGLSRLMSFYHADFIGSDAVRRSRWSAPPRALVGVALPHVVPLRGTTHASALVPRAQVTSRAWSPLFRCDLALAFVASAAAAPGTRVMTRTGVTTLVRRLPFYDPARNRPRRMTLSPA